MPKSFLLKPDDIEQRLRQRYDRQHKQWLSGEGKWPLVFPLGIPTEQQAFEHLNDVQQWQKKWLEWKGNGEIQWTERRWLRLGMQKLPERLFIHNPVELAHWAGQERAWRIATQRYKVMTKRWPSLAQTLPKYFKALADYSDTDFDRLTAVIEWLNNNPNSNLYIRQLPIEGVHTKWLLTRKSMIMDLLNHILNCKNSTNFYSLTGLRREPTLIRFRLLDSNLRSRVGDLGDLSVSVNDLKNLNLPVKRIYIVENLQTGLAFGDIPGAIVFMALGYAVDLLRDVPLLNGVPLFYWGDIDTDGFAILNRLRKQLPNATSVLMDEATLLHHQNLWGTDEKPKAPSELTMLTEHEKKLYADLCHHRWADNLRLEQERISWSYAWQKLCM